VGTATIGSGGGMRSMSRSTTRTTTPGERTAASPPDATPRHSSDTCWRRRLQDTALTSGQGSKRVFDIACST
jgi:hypothetical protein